MTLAFLSALALLAVLGYAARTGSASGAEIGFLRPPSGPAIGGGVDARLAAAASAVAGKPIGVRCWSARDWSRLLARLPQAQGRDVLGFALVGGPTANLAPAVCARLEALIDGRSRPADLLGSATSLVTLAHESEHTRGVANEAAAECYGMQATRGVAQSLGVDPLYAALAIEAYWARYSQELPAYQSPDCRDGGPLDLNPRSAVWP